MNKLLLNPPYIAFRCIIKGVPNYWSISKLDRMRLLYKFINILLLPKFVQFFKTKPNRKVNKWHTKSISQYTTLSNVNKFIIIQNGIFTP